MSDIHLSNYSDNKSIQIACDQSWTEPKWGPRGGLTDVQGVYEADDGRLYTFEDSLVTCRQCRHHREDRA